MTSSQDKIQFGETQGSRERQLHRMYNNPLFPDSERTVTQESVDQARHDDIKEFEGFMNDFNQLLEDVASLEGRVDSEVILELKERVDRMYDQCSCFSGSGDEYKNGLKRLYDTIMQTIRAAAQGDSVAMSELDKERAARDLHLQLVEYKLVADLLRADSPVGESELVATLLSEDVETVQIVMTLFDPEQQTAIRNAAGELINKLGMKAEVPGNIRNAFEAMLQQKQ